MVSSAFSASPDRSSELFDDFLHPFFRIPQRPTPALTDMNNPRACWAQAEMFISYHLGLGCHPDTPLKKIERGENNARSMSEFNDTYLPYCARVLLNMRDAGKFWDCEERLGFPSDISERGNGNGYGYNPSHLRCYTFLDEALVGHYGKDQATRNEMSGCRFLDRETKDTLQNMWKTLRREVERVWQARATGAIRTPDGCRDPSRSINAVHTPPPRVEKRVTFPYEPTMTESSVTDFRSRSNDYGHTANNPSPKQNRARRTTPTYSLPQVTDDRSRSRRHDSVRPDESSPQAQPRYDPIRDLDFSRLRVSSPPRSRSRPNNGHSSPALFGQEYGNVEFIDGGSSSRFRDVAPFHSLFDDPRDMISRSPYVGEDAYYRSRGRESRMGEDGYYRSKSREPRMVEDAYRRRHHEGHPHREKRSSGRSHRTRGNTFDWIFGGR